MNNYFILIFLIFINFLLIVKGDDVQCNTFVNSQSNTNPNECGSSLNDACSNISQSILNCGEFNEIIITISPGNYSINSETFGPITNKKITILNSAEQPINQPSVIINLSKSVSPFIRYIPTNINDTLTVSLNGITFENGIQRGSVLLNNGSGIINLSVVNCSFINMLDSSYGSTFSFANSSSILPTTNGIVTISKSTFSNSNSNQMGGFIYSINLPIEFTIDQSNFLGQNISGTGFSVAILNGYLSVSNTIIKGLYTKYPFFLQRNNGIKSTITTFTFNNVTFKDLTQGFGIMITGDETASTEISNCSFTNSVDLSPIFIQGIGKANIQSCTFTNNTNTLSLLNSSGGISIESTLATINDCVFLNNKARLGGAISLNYCLPQGVTITNSTFQGNSAQYFGGSIYNANCNTTFKNVDFSSLQTNVSTIYCTSSNMTFSSSNFTDSSKDINDLSNLGIICNSNPCSITIDSKPSIQCKYNENDSNENNHGLTTAQKILISFAIIIGTIIIIIIIVIIVRKVKKNREYKPFGY
ncbi:hypothetical protein ACTFIZ_011455 [Dictyostelium cf. discoideum]